MTKRMMTTAIRRWMSIGVGVGLVVALGSPVHASANQGALTITKVDSTGALLPGATFDGWMCTKYDTEPSFTCISLNDYGFFTEGLTNDGTTGTAYGEELDREGGWTIPIGECIVLQEKTAPTGYAARKAPALVCRGPGGYSVENALIAVPQHEDGQYLEIETAVGTRQFTPGLGDWTVTNDAATLTTTISLVNTRVTTPRPATPATTDPCNPAGTASNVAWATPLPASTASVKWSETGTTRTATLVDPAAVAWSDLTTAPISFPLPADSGVACPVTPITRGIGANTGVDSAS